MNDTEILLNMQAICKEFPGVRALDHVDFSVSSGEIRILIGENGAGKSTLMKILAGAYRPEHGTIRIDGEEMDLDHITPKRAIDAGVATIYQELNLNRYTSVYENIFYGRESTHHHLFIDKKDEIRRCQELLKKVGLRIAPTTLVSELSIAQMQMVEIAKALAFNARIIVFDEPTSSLTDTETRTLFTIIRELKTKGYGIIYISHRLEELFEIGDSCTVLRDGRHISTQPVSDLTVSSLIQMMVGRDLDSSVVHHHRELDETILEVSHITYGDLIKDISFDLKRGECLAFSGLVGAGRTELAKCLIGEYTRDGGEIRFKGRQILNRSVRESVRNGIVYLSEDRKKEGLFLKHAVQTNVTIASLEKSLNGWFISLRKERKNAQAAIERMRVKTPTTTVPAETLSGGNQQKMIIAKWLETEAEIFIFDEPTRGIDVGAKVEIYQIMEGLLAKGASIIMISSEMPEVLRMADRILVMREGCCQAILENRNLTQEEIFHYAIGANTYAGKEQ